MRKMLGLDASFTLPNGEKRWKTNEEIRTRFTGTNSDGRMCYGGFPPLPPDAKAWSRDAARVTPSKGG